MQFLASVSLPPLFPNSKPQTHTHTCWWWKIHNHFGPTWEPAAAHHLTSHISLGWSSARRTRSKRKGKTRKKKKGTRSRMSELIGNNHNLISTRSAPHPTLVEWETDRINGLTSRSRASAPRVGVEIIQIIVIIMLCERGASLCVFGRKNQLEEFSLIWDTLSYRKKSPHIVVMILNLVEANLTAFVLRKTKHETVVSEW